MDKLAQDHSKSEFGDNFPNGLICFGSTATHFVGGGGTSEGDIMWRDASLMGRGDIDNTVKSPVSWTSWTIIINF